MRTLPHACLRRYGILLTTAKGKKYPMRCKSSAAERDTWLAHLNNAIGSRGNALLAPSASFRTMSVNDGAGGNGGGGGGGGAAGKVPERSASKVINFQAPHVSLALPSPLSLSLSLVFCPLNWRADSTHTK